jgi:hypothetical protein
MARGPSSSHQGAPEDTSTLDFINWLTICTSKGSISWEKQPELKQFCRNTFGLEVRKDAAGHLRLCFARIKSAFTMNNIQRADVTLLCPVDDEVTIRHAQAVILFRGGSPL